MEGKELEYKMFPKNVSSNEGTLEEWLIPDWEQEIFRMSHDIMSQKAKKLSKQMSHIKRTQRLT